MNGDILCLQELLLSAGTVVYERCILVLSLRTAHRAHSDRSVLCDRDKIERHTRDVWRFCFLAGKNKGRLFILRKMNHRTHGKATLNTQRIKHTQ